MASSDAADRSPARGGTERRSESFRFPASFAQQRLWVADRLGDGAGYTVARAGAFRLRGRLDVAALTAAFDDLVARHESLRTGFTEIDGRPFQVVEAAASVELERVDLSASLGERAEEEVARRSTEAAGASFDLATGPLLRAQLLRLGEEHHVLLLQLHHIVTDGWSMGILLRELSALYAAHLRREPSPLPELELQYADFAVWQREWLSGERLRSLLDHWLARLAGAAPLRLPADPVPAQTPRRGAEVGLGLGEEVSRVLFELGRSEGATPFMTLLAAFFLVLRAQSGLDDLVVGTPTANRSRPELEGVVGLFANLLALRVDLAGDPSFRDLVGRTRQACLDAFEHQELPFDQLVEELAPPREDDRPPIFEILFSFDRGSAHELSLPGVEAERLAFDHATIRFPIECHLRPVEGGVEGELLYATDRWQAESIERLARRFERLAATAAADPDAPLSRLPLLGERERRTLLARWAGADSEAPGAECVHRLFGMRARERPEDVALELEDERIGYGELAARSARLAHHLIARGAVVESVVGVCLERSTEAIAALIAVLETGAAYLPLDPGLPRQRLEWMIADAGVELVVTRRGLNHCVADTGARPVFVDTHREAIERCPAQPPEVDVEGDDLAYVMYTSGSTGQPKASMIPHRAVAGLACGRRHVEVGPEDVFLSLAPLAFDAATFEIWTPLVAGSRLAIFPDRGVTPAALSAAIERHGVTVLWLTAPLFHQMIDEAGTALRQVRQLLAGGDVLSPSHVERALEILSETTLVNGYGPTEATTFSCCHRLSGARRSAGSVPIGRPVAGARVYVLDAAGRPVPIGAVGELHVGGRGLARGYRGDPRRTAERFVPDPFGERPGGRLYRTGDLARWRNDGVLEFHGRLDHQVKVRGFRVEPGEIEAALMEHPDIEAAVVTSRPDGSFGHRLVAYVVIRGEGEPATAAATLRRFLRDRLPEYMVPSLLLPVERLPTTASGKLDRAALASGAVERLDAPEERVEPRDELERTLLEVWRSVLGRRDFGIREDFFDLGGHSLLAVRLAAEVEKVVATGMMPRAVFRFSTVESMAELVRQAGSTPVPDSEEPRQQGLSPQERRDLLAVMASSALEPAAPDSLMTVLNRGGADRPLFWCFNEPSFEPAQLASELGSDLPLYAMLSGVGLLDWRSETPRLLAEIYLPELLAVQPEGPFRLGGNCAGGHVALELALALRARGLEVEALCLMEHFGPALYEYEGRTLLLYGRESHLEVHRTFNWRQTGWEKPFRVLPEVDWIPGAHGQFFQPDNVAALARRIRRFLES